MAEVKGGKTGKQAKEHPNVTKHKWWVKQGNKAADRIAEASKKKKK